jgi:hypothetical protein
MGLDQYAYVAARAGAYDEYYEDKNYDKEDSDPTKQSKPRELAYWRKHPNLQGWMKQHCGRRRIPTIQRSPALTVLKLELTWEDLERLELDIISGGLPETTGFFFGEDSNEFYYNDDLEFVKNAKAEIFIGLRVFYNSSW